MKKFTKVCLIIAAVLVVLGFGLITISAAMGGGFRRIPIMYTHNNWGWQNKWGWNWPGDEWYQDIDEAGKDWEEAKSEWNEAWSEAQQEWNSAWSDVGEELSGIPEELKNEMSKDFVLEAEQKFYGVKNLDIEVEIGGIWIMTAGTGDQIEVRIGTGTGEYQWYMDEDDTLKIVQNWKKRYSYRAEGQGRQIQILIPEGYQFDKVDVELKAGAFFADELRAEELEIDTKAGVAAIDQGEVTKLEAQCAAGGLIYKGQVAQTVSAECAAGALGIYLDGKETDYDYKISVGAGTMTVGDYSYAGLGRKQDINNPGSVGKMELECAAGTMEVRFSQ